MAMTIGVRAWPPAQYDDSGRFDRAALKQLLGMTARRSAEAMALVDLLGDAL